jgi:hypothetical protein
MQTTIEPLEMKRRMRRVSLPEDLVQEMEELARLEHRSAAAFARLAVQQRINSVRARLKRLRNDEEDPESTE